MAGLTEDAKLLPWLYRIANNTAIDGPRPPENAAALLLHAIECYSYEEIATIQGCSLPAARGRIARARAVFFKERWPSRDDRAARAAADVVLVNSVADGMNLVAKEAAFLNPRLALALSRAAGVVEELGRGALVIDPARLEDLAEASALARGANVGTTL